MRGRDQKIRGGRITDSTARGLSIGSGDGTTQGVASSGEVDNRKKLNGFMVLSITSTSLFNNYMLLYACT